jgi:hypothetical protein
LYRPGIKLPSYKQIAQKYGTSFRTIRKVLSHLSAQGYLEAFGRGFRVPETTTDYINENIGFFAITENMQVLSNYTPRAPEFWREFTKQCRSFHVRFHVFGLEQSLGEVPWVDGKSGTINCRIRTANYRGFVVWTSGMSTDSVERLLQLLVVHKLPVVVKHDNFSPPLSEVLQLVNRFKEVSMVTCAVSGKSGCEMARFLLGEGHRSAALFYYAKNDPMWETRGKEFEEEFKRSGLAHCVQRYYPEKNINFDTSFNVSRQRDIEAILQRLNRTLLSAVDFDPRAYADNIAFPRVPAQMELTKQFVLPAMMQQTFKKALHNN